MKIKKYLLVSSLIVSSCSTLNSNIPINKNYNFNIKSQYKDTNENISLEQLLNAPSYGDPVESDNKTNEELDYKNLSFYEEPPQKGMETIGDEITVFYSEYSNIRFNKKDTTIKSKDENHKKSIEKILKKYKVKNIDSFSDELDIQSDEEQKNISTFYKKSLLEVPNKKSIHNYKFPKEVNIKEVLKEIKSLPFVKMGKIPQTGKMLHRKN